MKRLCLCLCSLAVVATTAQADSLYREQSNRSMFADRRAFALGDILTIVVQQSTTASKDNSTKTAKSSSADANLESLLFSPAGSSFLTHNGKFPAVKFSSTHAFDGGGTVNNSEQIVDKISVRVSDVLPNRNLVIEGNRHTSFSGEAQDVVLRGVVRPEDVAANNTVYSYNVADATIKMVSKGAVTDSQKKGWFTKVWDKITPF